VSRVGVTVEGGLLAADLVERIALGDETVAGQKPKDFGLEAGRPSAEIQAAFSAPESTGKASSFAAKRRASAP